MLKTWHRAALLGVGRPLQTSYALLTNLWTSSLMFFTMVICLSSRSLPQGYRCMEPLVFDLFRRGLFEDAEGERVRHVVEEEFHRVGVRSFKFYEYTHKNAHTGQPEFTEWRCSRVGA